MSTSRLEALRGLVAQTPADSRVRFMLCMELMSVQRYEEALEQFDELIARHPDYVAAYFQAARACEALDRVDGARGYYTRGIETARRAGDPHAESEMQAALDLLA
jgi:tetratricopeptide (TPR) repeat protein